MSFNTTGLLQVFIALVALVGLGPIALNVYEIPFTLQTLIICLVTYYFGWRGVLAVALYICLGLLGLPVWSNYHVKPDILSTASGGFVMGFIPMAILLVLVRKKMGGFHNRGSWFFLAHVILVLLAIGINTLLGHGTANGVNLILRLAPGMIVKTLIATSFIQLLTMAKANKNG